MVLTLHLEDSLLLAAGYNPVKHNLIESPKDWKFSSFHRYVKKGIYDQNWGAGQELIFYNEVEHE